MATRERGGKHRGAQKTVWKCEKLNIKWNWYSDTKKKFHVCAAAVLERTFFHAFYEMCHKYRLDKLLNFSYHLNLSFSFQAKSVSHEIMKCIWHVMMWYIMIYFLCTLMCDDKIAYLSLSKLFD